MRNTQSFTRRLRRLSALLALMLALMPAALGQDLASELGGGLSAAQPETDPQAAQAVNMMTADAVIGCVEADFPTINPIYCNEWSMVSVNQLVYESVVDLDASMKPVPMLADSWTKEGKTWRFKLRSGISFHNGYELTAYDVILSYQVLASANTNPYYARLQMIKSVEMDAEDLYTVVVEGKTSSWLTLYAMNFPVMQYSTVSDNIPMGTGPYWYIQQGEDGTIRLEANPLWWKQQPAVTSILLKRYTEPGDAIEAIQTRAINMLSTKSPKASFSRRLSDIASIDYPTLTYEMLVPNLGDGSIMADVNVRKAVMFAIDRAVVASNAYLDMAIQCEVPILPTCWLYESQSAVYYYSPERALQLMQNSGWYDLTGDGRLNKRSGIMLREPTVRLITYNESTNSIRENAAELIASYLERVGFNVTVVVASRERVLEAVKEHNYDLALVGVNLSEIPDISALLEAGGSLNLNRYSNEAMNLLIENARVAGDEAALQKVYSEIQLTVVDRLPILGLLFRTGTVLSTRPIGGLTALRAYDNFNGFEFLK